MQASTDIQKTHRNYAVKLSTLQSSSSAPGYIYLEEILISAHRETGVRLFPALLLVIIRWGPAPWRVTGQMWIHTME